ncbi:MAG: hypothetical protein QG657_1905 [Acidobacteriota bacterium]|nr:hypothetical protein [Acidobacteriota bacterium]
MLIANPIYDTVFKYLMDNVDIAKGIIAAIIGEDIVHLELQAQESNVKVDARLTYYHLDFIAKIKQKSGGYKTVLIELQKSNNATDLLRFRRYLGEQYKKEEEIPAAGDTFAREPLPLITIYILGYYLSRTLPGVIKVNRNYIDLLAGEEISERNEFIECLTHDSYVIQIPGLHLQMKNRLEYVLSIFKQERFIADDHRLKDYNYEIDDELLKKILKQLEKAAANKELLRQLEVEEMAYREYDSTIGRFERQLEQKEMALIEHKQTIEKKDKALEEKDKALEENKKAFEENKKAFEENKKALEEKDKYITELLKKLKME